MISYGWCKTLERRLSVALHTKGFESNPVDKRVFNNTVDGKQCTICFHVDDLFITCKQKNIIDAVYGQFVEHYDDFKLWRGPKMSYPRMTFDFRVSSKCTIEGDVLGLIVDCGVTDKATSPAVSYLLIRVWFVTEKDTIKLQWILRYLNATGDLRLSLEVSDKINILGFVNASYGVLPDGKNRTWAAVKEQFLI